MSHPHPHSPVETVEQYLQALNSQDLSQAPLAEDIQFTDPLTPKLQGKQAVISFLATVLPVLKQVVIKQHIVQGNFVATLWDAETHLGVIPIFEWFQITNGEITLAQAFYDPRPLTNNS